MTERVASYLSHEPKVLYAAALERISEAERLVCDRSWALGVYVSGLAVEALLQAIALRSGKSHDARHDLRQWLRKCPVQVIDAISDKASDEWSGLTTVWRNDIRYWSSDGLFGHFRDLGWHLRIKTGPDPKETILKYNSSRVFEMARTVHNKGVILWPR